MTTRDAFLGGRLTLDQPASGFRAGVDSVMLAAAVPARPGESVLELGSGAGVAALCLACRVEGVAVTGLELQADLVALAARNAAANDLAGRVRFLAGAVEDPPHALDAERFDHAMMNPPFFVEGTDDAPPDAGKRLAHIADAQALSRWVTCARAHLAPRGRLTAIVPAERLPALLAALAKGFGGIGVFPLWPRPGVPAKRVLVRAQAGSRAPFALLPGLVLHGAGNGYTPEAEAVLRGGAGLPA